MVYLVVLVPLVLGVALLPTLAPAVSVAGPSGAIEFAATECQWSFGNLRCTPTYAQLFHAHAQPLGKHAPYALLTAKQKALHYYCAASKPLAPACDPELCQIQLDDWGLPSCEAKGSKLWLTLTCPHSMAYDQTACASLNPITRQLCESRSRKSLRCVYDPDLECTVPWYANYSHPQRMRYLYRYFHIDPEIWGCCNGARLSQDLLRCENEWIKPGLPPDVACNSSPGCWYFAGSCYLEEVWEARMRFNGTAYAELFAAQAEVCGRATTREDCMVVGSPIALHHDRVRDYATMDVDNRPLPADECTAIAQLPAAADGGSSSSNSGGAGGGDDEVMPTTTSGSATTTGTGTTTAAITTTATAITTTGGGGSGTGGGGGRSSTSRGAPAAGRTKGSGSRKIIRTPDSTAGEHEAVQQV